MKPPCIINLVNYSFLFPLTLIISVAVFEVITIALLFLNKYTLYILFLRSFIRHVILLTFHIFVEISWVSKKRSYVGSGIEISQTLCIVFLIHCYLVALMWTDCQFTLLRLDRLSIHFVIHSTQQSYLNSSVH